MWMGGFVPFGYEKRERKLVVNDAEAAIVRLIFQRYLEQRVCRLQRFSGPTSPIEPGPRPMLRLSPCHDKSRELLSGIRIP